MKQQLLDLSNKIDALTLRERAMVFVASAAAIVFVVYSILLGPLFAKQKTLTAQISQYRNNISGIDAEITHKVQGFALDPDAVNRERLAKAKADLEQLGNSLRAVQKGLVAPEQMAPLIETILRGNTRLRLVSMKTLPASPMSEGSYDAAAAPAAVAPAAAPAAPAKPANLLYRHGVQVTVRGNYLDMINYMDALEAMPTQLFWGMAALEVEEYPNSRLTLTLYTLSLDQKWMKL